MNTRLLNVSDIASRITMREVLDICDRTFRDMGEGGTVNPPKLGLDLGETSSHPPYEGFMNAMPAYVGWLDVAGLKWAGGFLGKRREMKLPYLTSLILLLDPHTGEFLAVLEGAYITNLRTGAQTAVALKYLKPNQRLRVGIFGAGMQARTQIAAISEWFDIGHLAVFDLYPDAARKFAGEMASRVRGDIVIADHPRQVAESCDTLICVTQAKEPFLRADWIRSGTVVFPMGSYQEIEDAVILQADAIVVDHVEQCLHRGALKSLADRGTITKDRITATIGDLAAGKRSVAQADRKRIVCIPIGTGAMDVAVAKIVYDKAAQSGSGPSLDFTA